MRPLKKTRPAIIINKTESSFRDYEPDQKLDYNEPIFNKPSGVNTAESKAVYIPPNRPPLQKPKSALKQTPGPPPREPITNSPYIEDQIQKPINNAEFEKLKKDFHDLTKTLD